MEEDPRVAERIASTGRYRLVRALGRGGMGAVFEVEHVLLHRRLAMKLLHGELAHDAEAAARFFQEARAAAAIGNPHIVDVMDVGVTDGVPFLVMELLAGPSLRKTLSEQGVMTIERAVSVARQCCRALAAAHAKGIVHRDLKPDNVVLIVGPTGPDFVKLVDFGIAKVVDRAARSAGVQTTQPGAVYGTPTYMAPEQLRGDRTADGRVDVWALGCLLFEMLSGAPPFVEETYAALAVRVLTEPTPSLVARRPEVSPALDAVVRRALAKDPASRFASMDALDSALAELEVKATPEVIPATGSMRPAVASVGRSSVDPLAMTTPAAVTPLPSPATGHASSAADASPPPPPAHRTAGGAGSARRSTATLLLGALALVAVGVVGTLAAVAVLGAGRTGGERVLPVPPPPSPRVASHRGPVPAGVLPDAGGPGAAPPVAPGSPERPDAAGALAGIEPVAPVLASPGPLGDARVHEPPGARDRRRPERAAPPNAAGRGGAPVARPSSVASPSPLVPPTDPERRVRIHNGRQLPVTVTLACGGSSRTVSLAAGASSTLTLPAVECRVECRAAGAIPLCASRLAPTATELSVR